MQSSQTGWTIVSGSQRIHYRHDTAIETNTADRVSIRRMIDLRKHIVFPGQFVITSVPTLISTVLGSCVSVCLWDRETKVAGMNHYLLPGTWEDDAGNSNRGMSSIRMLIRSMINRRSNLGNVEANVFGGCNSLYRKNDLFKVGERNV